MSWAPAGALPQSGFPIRCLCTLSSPTSHLLPPPHLDQLLFLTTLGSSVLRGGHWEQVRCRAIRRASILCSLPYKGMSFFPQTLHRTHLASGGTLFPSRVPAGQLGIRQEARGQPTVLPNFLGTARAWFILIATSSRHLPPREGTSDVKNPT